MIIVTASACFATKDTARAELEKAWENLKLARATQLRIEAKIEQLKQSGNASPEIIEDYEAYLRNVQLMVLENQRLVQNMEAAYSGESDLTDLSSELKPDPSLEPRIPEDKKIDKLAELDRELDNSLAAFDEMLLKRLELIRSQSADKMTDLAIEAADAASRAAGNQEASATGSEENSDASEGDRQNSENSNNSNDKRGDDADPSAPGKNKKGETTEAAGRGQDIKRPGKKGDTRSGEDRTDYADKQDDDIVARQLREAAENETDPELREKLWEKYEEYKKNTR
jgi:hypothetical protein